MNFLSSKYKSGSFILGKIKELTGIAVNMHDKGHGGTSTTGNVVMTLFSKHIDVLVDFVPRRHRAVIRELLENLWIILRCYTSGHQVYTNFRLKIHCWLLYCELYFLSKLYTFY